MLELMNKYPKINRYVWFISSSVIVITLVYLLLNGLPIVLKALADYQQITGK